MGNNLASFIVGVICISAMLLPAQAQPEQNPVAQVGQSSRQIEWTPQGDHWQVSLRILDSVGVIAQKDYRQGERIVFDLAGLADGVYRWELIAEPVLEDSVLTAAADAQAMGQRTQFWDDAKRRGEVSRHPVTQSGTFSVVDGSGSLPDLLESGEDAGFRLVLNEDQIVRGSQCVGLDCPSAPAFGFITVLLQENNTRIKFDDTSSSAAFPNNDWALVANDSANGGANKFAITDCGVADQGDCDGNEVFVVEAEAPDGALFIDDSGRVGLSTTTPLLKLHLLDIDTPAIRLEQRGGGFTPQVWDVGANESNYFVRDVTAGNRLPFRIFPGAATDTLTVGRDDRVGVGTSNPESLLHVQGNDDSLSEDNSVQLRVENGSGVEGDRSMVDLVNNGGAAITFEDTSTGLRWRTQAAGKAFTISLLNTNSTEFALDAVGNLIIAGALTQGSDRHSKRDIEPVEIDRVLERVASMPISTWSYKTDDAGVRHIGPMAQDFHAAFGFGADRRSIAALDTSGVALAAVQALHRRIEELKAELAQMRAELEAARDDD